MAIVVADKDFQQLKQSLPAAFQDKCTNELTSLSQAFPLLNMVSTDRELVARLAAALKIDHLRSNQAKAKQIMPLCAALSSKFNPASTLPYRLPVVLSEFPIHSRAVNKAILQFNQLIERFHQDPTQPLDVAGLEREYQAILAAVTERGALCDPDTTWHLLMALAGWSTTSPLDFLQPDTTPPVEPVPVVAPEKLPQRPIVVAELNQPSGQHHDQPLSPDYNHNLNTAGLLSSQTVYVLINSFGMKIAGHSDAQVKYPPRFLALDELHAGIRKQLTHRIDVWPTPAFSFWIDKTLQGLGVQFITKEELSKDLLVNPFLDEPMSFLTPEKVRGLLQQNLADYTSDAFNPSKEEIDIVGQYLFELIQRFQTNPGLALGIGANWDGTVNLANESGAHAFRFSEAEGDWARRFTQLSLHRQGPSEAKMNATIGVKFEIQALATNFDHMTQIQPSEWPKILYDGIVDNIVADLFPAPAYNENKKYQKCTKKHVVRRDQDGIMQVESFLQPNSQGTYYLDAKGVEKQTPMYQQAGTLDRHAFPRNTTCSEQTRECYAGHPLGPLLLQYSQALSRSARGHVVYDPIAPDKFLEDAFYGQVIRSDNGDLLPFIGVIPENFDKYFAQDNELCASFVMRMMQSSRIMEYCPTFSAAVEQIKTLFLPSRTQKTPLLPAFCSRYLRDKLQDLTKILADENRSFAASEKELFSLFKNLIYSLYPIGKTDEHFRRTFMTFISAPDTFNPVNKAKCDKLIRDLTVNRPTQINAFALAQYDATLQYLRDLNGYFYPAPTEQLAREVAQQARLYAPELLKSKGVQTYFTEQREVRHNNLSRKLSPGMLYAELKHQGPSKTIIEDASGMHGSEFESYYRDSDGTPIGKPQPADIRTDAASKILGAGLQFLHRYHLLAFIRRPLSEPYLQAKEAIAAHANDPMQFWWGVQGAIKGLLWDGIVLGIWQTTMTPFNMIIDFLRYQCGPLAALKVTKEVNPLAFSAAPANDPSVKTQEAAFARDFLLQLLSNPEHCEAKKNALITWVVQLMLRVYKLPDDQLVAYIEQLNRDFPLNEEKWRAVFAPLGQDCAKDYPELAEQLQHNVSHVNKNLLNAVFKCLTNPKYASQPSEIIKQTRSFFSLDPAQFEVLKQMLALYHETPVAKRAGFISLFQFDGTLHKALKKRDHALQKLQQYMLKPFEKHWGTLPTLAFNDDILREDKLFSEKDKAHQKWADFAKRELKHQVLDRDKANEVVALLAQKLPKQQALLDTLKTAFQQLIAVSKHSDDDDDNENEDSLDRFYQAVLALQAVISSNKPLQGMYLEAQTVLNDFCNVTMNAIVNARMDGVDLYADNVPQNPLLVSQSIENWLRHVQATNRDLRSLFDQQVKQSPSMDHALWRSKCLLQVLEKEKPTEKIKKTGMQSMLRFWRCHKEAVTNTGEPYMDVNCERHARIALSLINDSATMKHAIERVRMK